MEEQIEQLATRLQTEGVELVFGITGSGPTWSLITSLESRGVRYYSVTHEAAGALMAGAATRVSGRLAVSLSIKGPGLANMVAGIAHNYLENIPTLSIAEAFGDDAPHSRQHKRLDHRALLASVTKSVAPLHDVNSTLDQLLACARSEPPGPVHLDLCQAQPPGRRVTSRAPAAPPARAATSRQLTTMVRRSVRPVVIVGALACRSPWANELAQLRVPVLTTVAAKGVLDERLAHAAGVFTGAGQELAPEASLLTRADLVVGLGLRNTEVLLARPFGKPAVLLDVSDGERTEGFQAAVLARAPVEVFHEALATLRNRDWGLPEVAAARRSVRRELVTRQWLPGACLDVLSQLTWKHRLVVDTGVFCTVAEHLWQAGPARMFLGSSIARSMGASIPQAIGTALASPGQPLFCMVGDGGMRMYPAEIRLAVAERLPICFILMADGRFGSIVGPRPEPTRSRRAIDVPENRWTKIVEAMGCPSRRVASRREFTRALADWSRREPFLIEARFDPGDYAVCTRRLR